MRTCGLKKNPNAWTVQDPFNLSVVNLYNWKYVCYLCKFTLLRVSFVQNITSTSICGGGVCESLSSKLIDTNRGALISWSILHCRRIQAGVVVGSWKNTNDHKIFKFIRNKTKRFEQRIEQNSDRSGGLPAETKKKTTHSIFTHDQRKWQKFYSMPSCKHSSTYFKQTDSICISLKPVYIKYV